MFADPVQVPVYVGSGATAKAEDWPIISLQGNAAVRKLKNTYDQATVIANCPDVMKVSHARVGKGVNARQRHLFRLETSPVVDGVKSTDKVASLYLVADLPDAMDSPSSVRAHLWVRMLGWLANDSIIAGNSCDTVTFERWINGES